MTFDNKEIQKGYMVLGKGLDLADAKRQSKTAYIRMKSPTYQEVCLRDVQESTYGGQRCTFNVEYFLSKLLMNQLLHILSTIDII